MCIQKFVYKNKYLWQLWQKKKKLQKTNKKLRSDYLWLRREKCGFDSHCGTTSCKFYLEILVGSLVGFEFEVYVAVLWYILYDWLYSCMTKYDVTSTSASQGNSRSIPKTLVWILLD